MRARIWSLYWAVRKYIEEGNYLPEYVQRARQEKRRFSEVTEVHDLPPIFHYWSNKHLRPKLESLGFSNPDEFYASHILSKCRGSESVRCVSIGAGNCDLEVRIAQALLAGGSANWTMTCLELVPEMLERGRAAAISAGVAEHFLFRAVDVNSWDGDGRGYDVIIANQCLHHFVELERLFDRVTTLAGRDGIFITCDMIGRNGHQRWPEALEVIERFWEELPIEYRYNHQLRRQENTFIDWDCSTEGFEGIRSQDILPLLCERFGFHLFFGFGGLIDPFVDRSYGGNFDPEKEWDRDFIDRVEAASNAGLEEGWLTPTQMFAVMTTDKNVPTRTWKGQTPSGSIRRR